MALWWPCIPCARLGDLLELGTPWWHRPQCWEYLQVLLEGAGEEQHLSVHRKIPSTALS